MDEKVEHATPEPLDARTPAALRANGARTRVVFVGCCDVRPPGCCRNGAEHRTSRDLLVRPLCDVGTIVLGPRAATELDPWRVRSALNGDSDRVVFCDAPCDMVTAMRWARAGFVRAERREVVGARSHAGRRISRPPCAAERLSPRTAAPCSAAAHAISLLAALDDLRVDSWAAKLGWSERKLRVVLVGSVGASPRQVLTTYRLTVAVELRRQGASSDDCAAAADYRDVTSMYRALRAHGDRLPRRGAGQRPALPEGA